MISAAGVGVVPLSRKAVPPLPRGDVRIGFRHCDPRYPFLWTTADQPPARWHAAGEGPANYFCDTPDGAWAEFLRHEEIVDAADLAGVRRSLWAVALPADGYAQVPLGRDLLQDGGQGYGACQARARQLRAQGATRLQTFSAALRPGTAGGWRVRGAAQERAPAGRDGLVWVLYGTVTLAGWPAAEAASPPQSVLPLVRPW